MNTTSKNIQKKMQTLMYQLTKNAARYSYKDFLEHCSISDEEYEEIKKLWKDKLNVKPYV
jgi:hypothetical protein